MSPCSIDSVGVSAIRQVHCFSASRESPAEKLPVLVAEVISLARRTSATLLAMVLLLSLGSAVWAQGSKTDTSEKKVTKEFYTAKDRQAAMHAASLFKPKAVSEADITAGPAQDKKQFQLHFNDKVICNFDSPGVKMGGKTPKFACKITRVESADGQVQEKTEGMDEEAVKVKFGATDNEVFAEIVSTRLMWAIGYYADAWYPVTVECHGCPEDPISGSGATATRTYAVAKPVTSPSCSSRMSAPLSETAACSPAN